MDCLGPIGFIKYEPHCHKCEKCGWVWAHDPTLIEDQTQFERSHDCPQCGTTQSYTYKGTEKPACTWDGNKVESLSDCNLEYLPQDEKSVEKRMKFYRMMYQNPLEGLLEALKFELGAAQ